MRSFRFPKQARIAKSGDFERIWKQGTRIRLGSLEARYATAAHPQLGIAVNRQAGNAVVRNRLKRWIREHYRTHPDLFSTPVQFVIVIRKDIPRTALVRDFERLWSRCG